MLFSGWFAPIAGAPRPFPIFRTFDASALANRFWVIHKSLGTPNGIEQMGPTPDTIEAARGLAAEGLAYIANDNECLSSFLASSGLDPARIREVAAETGFLAGTLDFLMHNESLLISFAAHCGVSPEEVVAAHRTLAGPPVWE